MRALANYNCGGQVTEVVSYTPGGRIETIQRAAVIAGVTTTEQFHYEFNTQGCTTTVTYRRRVDSNGWDEIRRATYEYYDGATAYGSSGDLMRVRVQEPSGTSWNNVEQSYYRYYKSGDSNGFVHGLKYVVEPDGYAAMLADALDPTTADGAVLLQYSKYYFQYDADQRVTTEFVDRGSIALTFAYTTSSHANGYNHWKRKTVETLPDGAIKTVYTNYIGQVLLSQLTSGSDTWITARKYDGGGRLVEVANPSAVLSYSDTSANLSVSLRTNEGLIELSSYYNTTGSGAAEGYLKSTSVKQGTSGTPVLQNQLEYTSRTAGGTTIYPVSKQTQYRNDDGSGAINTSFSFTWHSGTVQVDQQVTTWPAIPTSQNGSGVADTRKAVFDSFGNQIWSMDPRGFITHTTYDIPTGAVVQRIEDADTSVLSGVPSGWSTPTGGGRHLVTDYEIDSRGRTTQELGPTHTVDLGGTANWSPRTIDRRSYSLRRFITWFRERGIDNVDELTSATIEAYRRSLFHYRNAKTEKPLKFATQASYLMAVPHWLGWLSEERLVAANPAADVQLPKEECRLPAAYLTLSEVETLINATDVTTPAGLRDRAILETFYSTGMRRSELLALALYDLDTERRLVMIRQGKGRKDRVVPIGQRAMDCGSLSTSTMPAAAF